MSSEKSTERAAPDPWEIGFGVACVGFALLALSVWFPRDIVGGFTETNAAGKVGPGDAFFPTLLASSILLLGGIHVLKTLITSRGSAERQTIGRLSQANFSFLVRFHLVVGLGLAAMYLLGPLTVAVSNALLGGTATYRELVDTPPYKYVGYVSGALLITLPLIHWASGRTTLRTAVVVVAVILATIVLFDGLLRNVQLPPNADI